MLITTTLITFYFSVYQSINKGENQLRVDAASETSGDQIGDRGYWMKVIYSRPEYFKGPVLKICTHTQA